MADQADNRIDANSSSPRQIYSEGQLAITDAEMAQQQAAQQAAEPAFRAASRRPAQNNVGSVQQALQAFKRKGK